jgi:Family of unknown function (DUF6459)
LTTSIAEPRPQQSCRPVLRRLIDILPAEVPVSYEPPRVTTLPVADPAAAILAERVLRATVEALHGRRSISQLSTMLCPDVLDHVITLKKMTGHLKPHLHKVLAHPQAPGVLETVAVVKLSTGVRALAARFEECADDDRRRWRCTALQLRLTAGDLATLQGHQPRRGPRS